MKKRLPYKYVSIVKGKPNSRYPFGDWYIQFYLEKPGKPHEYEVHKRREGLNRIHDLEKKEFEAQLLLREIKKRLRDGVSLSKIDKIIEGSTIKGEKEAAKKDNWLISEAIIKFRHHYNTNNFANRTIVTYSNYLNNLSNWIKEAGGNEKYACDYTEFDIVPFLDEVSDEQDWSPRTYNNNFKFWGTFFSKCQALERKEKQRPIVYNFVMSDGVKPENPQRNKAYPKVISDQIKKKLNLPGRENLKQYIEWIYLSMMRPKEIRELKRENIDERSRQIRIKGKTGDRLIPISDQLMKLIEKRGVIGLDHRYYIFGAAGKPSLKNTSRNFFCEKYAEIKKELSLDHNYTAYGWKHTSVIAMSLAGFKDEQIMVLSGHTTIEAFRAYKRDLIIDYGHAMKGSTIDF